MTYVLMAFVFPAPVILAELVVHFLKKRGIDGSLLLRTRLGIMLAGYVLLIFLVLPRYFPLGYVIGF